MFSRPDALTSLMKPPLPTSAPWQAPELQPTFVSSGMTWLRKLHSSAVAVPLTRTRAVAFRPSTVAVTTGIACLAAKAAPRSAERLTTPTSRAPGVWAMAWA